MSYPAPSRRPSRVPALAVLSTVLVVALLLTACGGPTPTPQILVVTATPSPEGAVLVVTATFTPEPVQIVTATFTPAPAGGATPVPPPTVQQPVQPGNTATPPPPPTAESGALPPPTYFTFEHSSGAFSVDIPDTSDYNDIEDGLYFSYGESLFMVFYSVVDQALTTEAMEQLVSTVIDDALVGEGLISSYDHLVVEPSAGGNAVASAFSVVLDSGDEGEGQVAVLQSGRTVYTLILLTPDYDAIADVWETLTKTLRVTPMETAEATATPVPPTAAATAKPTAKPVSLKAYFIVYTSFQGPDLQDYSLWGANGDGSGAFRIEGAGQASEPAFSPDGNKFAFYHWVDGIYIWDLNKKTSMRIVDNSEASFPTWAPNGARLAYANLYGQPWVHIVNSDGSGDHQLTPGLRPNWALKGGFIAYDSCENNKCGIFRINPDGGGKRQLTTDGGGGAAVSPNGKKIAYWSRADGDFEIYVINADGSGRKQLTKNRGNDALPAWSPDGKYIYYLSDQNGKGWAVMVMNANGSNQRKVVKTNAGNDPRRGWQYQRITVTWND